MEEVRAGHKVKKPGWMKYGVIAACLCLTMLAVLLCKILSNDVLSAPGFLTVTAYAASSDKQMVMQEGQQLPVDYFWSPSMDSRPGFALKLFDSQNHSATFEVSVDGGSLLLWDASGMIEILESPADIENDGTTVYWSNFGKTAEENFIGDKAFITVLTRENDHVLGYAVIEIYTDGENGGEWYYSELIKSVSFPKNDDGSYQNISDKYIASQVEQIKADARGIDTTSLE